MDMGVHMSQTEHDPDSSEKEKKEQREFYKIRFREKGQLYTVSSQILSLSKDEIVMVKTDHGLEPAVIAGKAPLCSESWASRGASYRLVRRVTFEEKSSFEKLPLAEENAFAVCCSFIDKHKLEMSLVRVEKFFNGSKMIFYFTADNRVDFRELVKDLVQEFRTRVEMRQVGVRHETKMLGGLGTCGRELCCSSYMKKFDSVSIKMAKEQDLPLNPAKISGVCNRLLCCLTYEFQTYKGLRKTMPKVGSHVRYQDIQWKVKRQIPLQEVVVLGNGKGDEIQLGKDDWENLERVRVDRSPKKKKSKPSQN